MNSFSVLVARCAAALLFLAGFVAQVSASYFRISEPTANTQWVNGEAHLVQWEKGLLDGVNGFDIEMARLTQNGLMLLAMNVPAKQGKINLYLQDVPPGDDYFLIFINSTHGVMHANSERFTVLAAGSSPTSPPSLTPAPSVPTVTIKGGPDPTQQFYTTFAAIPGSATPRRTTGALLVGMVGTLTAVLLGAGCIAGW